MKHFFKTIILGVAALTLAACTQSNNQNAEKYRAYAYVDQVANEYIAMLNS